MITDRKLIQTLEFAKSQLTTLEKKPWKTHCSLDIGGVKINLHTCNDMEKIINAAKLLLADYYSHEHTLETLSLNGGKYNYLHSGFTIDDWVSDLKQRVLIIQHKEKQDKINNSIKELEAMTSEEFKQVEKFSKIESMLSSL